MFLCQMQHAAKTLLLFYFLFQGFVAQGREAPHVRNFSPADYNAQNQNWSLTQAPHGWIYAGNNGGMLEFDGARWQPFFYRKNKPYGQWQPGETVKFLWRFRRIRLLENQCFRPIPLHFPQQPGTLRTTCTKKKYGIFWCCPTMCCFSLFLSFINMIIKKLRP